MDSAWLERARHHFLRMGFVKLPYLASPETKHEVPAEVETMIAEHSVRRDLVFPETGHTPRRMRNVRHAEIVGQGSVVPEIYAHPAMLRALETVAGEQVFLCPTSRSGSSSPSLSSLATRMAGTGTTTVSLWSG